MALKSFRDRNKYAVGLVSMATLAVILVATFLVGNLGLLEGGYMMSGVFADSGGVRTGNDVRVAGVRVGEVTEVRPDYAQGHVIVTWRVDDDVRLGRGTRADIALSNLLGGRYVKLTGAVSAPYMDQLPEPQRRIPMDRTGVPTLINDAIKDATRLVERLDTEAVDDLLTELGKVDLAKRGRITRLMENIGDLSDTISKSEPQLQRLLDHGTTIMEVLEKKDKQLVRLIDGIEVMLSQLRKRRNELRVLLGDGSDLVQSTTRLINEHERSLIQVLDDNAAITTRLSEGNEQLNSLLAWAGPTFSGLSTMGGQGPWLEAIATGLGPINPEVLSAIAKDRRNDR
ncbi:phospholipid/cholesterol/gamma-HCH transport system substrate-binding protein [Nonomuraea polychroma]|uniref:Phospholipid/cholesterol/gamma-HCH transport system substrate-binding protein n=1 Tax=Nonomuraea polychroma TaxID=46176 RepID=A0A438M239_9ACTN|nr:MlaD family protein [Nonomuraea polychroma]RVX39667.1 phospholipid/cholesterol/gamma-HCH transport system substrate-binding protein [Nonomuraea polychroma]